MAGVQAAVACHHEPHGGAECTGFLNSLGVVPLGPRKWKTSENYENGTKTYKYSAKMKVMIASELTVFMGILIHLSACVKPAVVPDNYFLVVFVGLLISCSSVMACAHLLASSHLHHFSLCAGCVIIWHKCEQRLKKKTWKTLILVETLSGFCLRRKLARRLAEALPRCPLLATMYYVPKVLFLLHELFIEQITIYLRLCRVQFLHASFYPGR